MSVPVSFSHQATGTRFLLIKTFVNIYNFENILELTDAKLPRLIGNVGLKLTYDHLWLGFAGSLSC